MVFDPDFSGAQRDRLDWLEAENYRRPEVGYPKVFSNQSMAYHKFLSWNFFHDQFQFARDG